MDDLTKCYTVKEVAERLGVTEDWVRDLIQTKQLRAVKVGRWRVYPEDLEKFIRSRANL